MKAFTRETSIAIAIPGINCDTDQIIPGRFLKLDRAQGYGRFLFHDIRRTKDGALDPAFPLNHKGAETARILIVEDNFGCGSSREGAVYALVDHGIRALIAPGFGDIFYNNALKNGLLAIRLHPAICKLLADYVSLYPKETIAIDLERSEVKLPGGFGVHPILIEDFARDCLLRGIDEIEMSFSYLQQIESFEKRHLVNAPWLAR